MSACFWDISCRILGPYLIDLTGYITTKIVYSVERQRWEIVHSVSNKTLAFTKTGTSKLPIGNNRWYFTQSNCSDEGKEYRTLNLLQDAEQPGNFCCYDGTCFSSEFVCDGTLHCESGEDEDFCEMIKVPKYYNKYDPPKHVYVNISHPYTAASFTWIPAPESAGYTLGAHCACATTYSELSKQWQ